MGNLKSIARRIAVGLAKSWRTKEEIEALIKMIEALLGDPNVSDIILDPENGSIKVTRRPGRGEGFERFND